MLLVQYSCSSVIWNQWTHVICYRKLQYCLLSHINLTNCFWLLQFAADNSFMAGIMESRSLYASFIHVLDAR